MIILINIPSNLYILLYLSNHQYIPFLCYRYAEMKEKFTWKIECNHTPETIDRIMMPIRKRGLCLIALNYSQKDQENAICSIEFEVEPSDSERIYKNLIRIHDIQNVIR